LIYFPDDKTEEEKNAKSKKWAGNQILNDCLGTLLKLNTAAG
jgi:hypothetical protein